MNVGLLRGWGGGTSSTCKTCYEIKERSVLVQIIENCWPTGGAWKFSIILLEVGSALLGVAPGKLTRFASLLFPEVLSPRTLRGRLRRFFGRHEIEIGFPGYSSTLLYKEDCVLQREDTSATVYSIFLCVTGSLHYQQLSLLMQVIFYFHFP